MRLRSAHRVFLVVLGAVVLGAATPAHAERALITEKAIEAKGVPGGSVEGACGLAFRSGQLYVSDYYHDAIDVFANSAVAGFEFGYGSQLPFNSSSGPCQLATGPSSALYANDWHEGVSRVLPSALSFDEEESTGVAVDQATGTVYVNDRTYVAVYEPSGALKGKVGEGTLTDAYGLAFAGGKLYVPDAATKTIKVYEPAIDPVNPAFTIDGHATAKGGFTSLTDAAVAIDPTNSHLIVLDNLQPGFEHPQAAIEEFEANGTFLGQLAKKVIDGGPSGIAFSGAELYVTSGNTEESKVFHYGPYSAGGGGGGGSSGAQPTSASKGEQTSLLLDSIEPLTQAVVIQRAGIRVSLEGKLAPKKLPRHGSAPIRVAVGVKIDGAEAKEPPQLRTISLAINRYGHFDPTGLAICTERDIQPATNQNALKACRSSLVGVGSFEADVSLSEQSPFPAKGKMYAFNARVNGKPAILAHVYGKKPVATSFTFPFLIRLSKGTFGTVLVAQLPKATGTSGYITGLQMNLGRNFTYKGKRRSYLTGSCPAPKGFGSAVFPLARAGFAFKGGRKLSSTLTRSCGVR